MTGIGYFREYHGIQYPPFVQTAEAIAQKEQVLRYMRKGHVIAAAPGMVKDVFKHENVAGEMLAYCDGEYYWGSEAIYYFEKYNMQLPKEFIDHIVRH